MFDGRITGGVIAVVAVFGAACDSGKETPSSPSEGVNWVPADPPVALTPTERNNSVRDLLGFPSDGGDWPDPPAIAARFDSGADSLGGVFAPAVPPPPWPAELPAEAGIHGFDGMIDGQEPSAYGVEAWQQAALTFSTYALVSRAFFACEDWAALGDGEQRDCGWDSVARFAARAWRQPLSSDETTRLQGVWDGQLAQGTVEEAIVITVAGILSSPRFTHRIEVGLPGTEADHARRLTGFERASRLSYFLWDSMPDAALFLAAERGELETDAQIRDQVRRMLADPKAVDAAVRFHHAWLGTDAVLGIAPARAAHGPTFGLTPETPDSADCDLEWPGVVGPLRHALYADLSLTFADQLFDGDGTLTALLTTDVGYRAAVSAPLYGDVTVDSDAAPVSWPYTTVVASSPIVETLSMERVTMPPGERAGVLASPAVLAVGAYPVHPGPIPRGVMVSERVLCQDLGSPPDGAEAAAPADVAEADSTNRERTEAATASPECAACHDRINPLGFAFEHYDALGAWRATDNGAAVDASVEVTVDGVAHQVEDAVELGAVLAKSDEARACYALHQIRVASGLDLHHTDPRIAGLVDGFTADDHIPTLLEEIALSDLFGTVELVEAP